MLGRAKTLGKIVKVPLKPHITCGTYVAVPSALAADACVVGATCQGVGAAATRSQRPPILCPPSLIEVPYLLWGHAPQQ